MHKVSLLLIAITAAFYLSFGYDLERYDLIKLIGLYSAVFYLSWNIYKIEKRNFWFLAGVALLMRLIFFGAIPNLSQDFYRFIWDGRMILEGWNPYLHLPENLIKEGTVTVAQASKLYEGMGELSGSNYTNYPPLNQFIFALAGLFAGKSILGSIVVMRVVIIAADFGVLYFGKKLLENLNLPVNRIFWYILNPFIIIELTGNLHFEGVMLFFLIWSLYLLHKKKWILSAIVFAASVSLKLVPLLFLPLLLRYFTAENSQNKLNFWKLCLYYLIVVVLVIFSFLPFLSSAFISNFSASIGLWFQKFEFNASIYYLIRWVGFQVKGYNIIETAGKVLPVIVILILAGLAIFRKNNSPQRLITTMLLGVSIYFFLSTTVHPWYIATPLLLSVFTRYRFAVIWSFVVIFSYAAYSDVVFRENLWLVALEYIVVIGMFIYQILNENRKKTDLFL
ncbi:hypothetical protein GILI108418_08515 [Gillisia limnaea]|uniref:Mannosyltransferase n=2 Tax=Gillisia TaxID=244698 RepID=H2BRV6_GILLR|nr:hypothetical protein Gilli_1801 [Gillisia limnaea DSM 15749]